MMAAGKLAEWVALAATAVAGGLWLGAVDSNGKQNAKDIDALATVPADLATLTERVNNVKMVVDRINAKQDKVIEELQKK